MKNIATEKTYITKDTEFLYLEPTAYIAYGTSLLPFCNNNAAHRTTLSLRLLKQTLGSSSKKDLTYQRNRPKLEYNIKTERSLLATPYEKSYEEK